MLPSSFLHLLDINLTREEKAMAMAPHSSTLAWEIQWREEPRGLQSMGSQRLSN